MRKIKVVVLLVRQLQHGFTKNAKVSPNLTVTHMHNFVMDFPQFKVPNGGLHEERYSEKTNDNKDIFSSVTCSLHSIECNKYFERYNF